MEKGYKSLKPTLNSDSIKGDPFGAKTKKGEESKIFSIGPPTIPTKPKFPIPETTCGIESILLEKFDIKKLRSNNGKRIFISGSPGYGKTHLVVDLMQEFIDIETWKIYDPYSNHKYISRIPSKSMLFNHNFEENVNHFIQRQEKVYNESGKDTYKSWVQSCLVIDPFPLYIKPDFDFHWIFKNKEPFGSTIFLTSDYLFNSKGFQVTEIKQLGDVYFFGPSNLSSRKEIYNTFFSELFKNYGEWNSFDDLFTTIVKDHRFLVFDRTVESTELKDKLFFYVASPVSPKYCISSDFYTEIDNI